MRKLNTDEARLLVDEAILAKKEKELDDIFTAIKDACCRGEYIVYLEKICYPETIDILRTLGYIVNTNVYEHKNKWCSYTISWVKKL